jgi:O-antigen ligase
MHSRTGSPAIRPTPPRRAPQRLAKSPLEQELDPRITFKIAVVLVLWAILLFNPHWFLAARGIPGPVRRIQFLPLGILALLLLPQVGRLKFNKPLLAYAVFVVLTGPFAYNAGMALGGGKTMVVQCILMFSTLTLLQSSIHVRTIVLMLLLFRSLWFGLHGLRNGIILWDPVLANQDAYGSIMAVGAATAGALAAGALDKKMKILSLLIAIICMGGLVSSFARGAFLVGAMSLAFLWFRAQGKRLALAFLLVLMAAITFVAGSFFVNVEVSRGGGSRNFFSEIASISDDIADTDAEDRRLIWRIGWNVFLDYPLIGVGTGAWSAYAADNYSGAILGERYGTNPERLWGRAMHNIFLQELAEHGLIGFLLFMWIFVDLWLKVGRVRRRSSPEDASIIPGFRTRYVATAFEVNMLALMGAGMLYNVISMTFYGPVIAATLFYNAWEAQQAPVQDARRSLLNRRPPRRQGRAPGPAQG